MVDESAICDPGVLNLAAPRLGVQLSAIAAPPAPASPAAGSSREPVGTARLALSRNTKRGDIQGLLKTPDPLQLN